MPEPRLFLDAKAILAESPVWDPEARELVWTDITSGLLHRTAADGSDDRSTPLPPPVASFQRRRGGGLVVALKDSVVLTDDEGASPETLVEIPHLNDGIRFNEGKCDPFGNFVVGGMDFVAGEPDAALYRVTPAGDVTVLQGGFGTANGFEWNDDGSVMWVTDTSVETVFRASWGPDGVLGELIPWSVGGMHDGLVRDERGEFWGCLYGEGLVTHLSADGDLIDTIAFDAPNLTGIAFGGDDLRTLFVCSARENLTEQQLEEHPASGGIFAVELDRAGRQSFLFG
ncbi:SMP-30/gluconolactonase/LRE family protein [Frondihabitans cladoniiphilus]|uniref:SMP-30/gluconolactonase/LRE family protein n=1 Tax=Frondihabitans cladoniiphilus TaxID=715785 RepID=A0ABP8VSM8_9MICO